MNKCPCCGYSLLRHTNGRSIYWFCLHCWQEMPNLEELRISIYRKSLDRSIEISAWVSEEEPSLPPKTKIEV